MCIPRMPGLPAQEVRNVSSPTESAGCSALLMASASSVAPRRMMASMSLGVTTSERFAPSIVSASITVGTPTATTGTPSVCW